MLHKAAETSPDRMEEDGVEDAFVKNPMVKAANPMVGPVVYDMSILSWILQKKTLLYKTFLVQFNLVPSEMPQDKQDEIT